jgi:protein SCO1
MARGAATSRGDHHLTGAQAALAVIVLMGGILIGLGIFVATRGSGGSGNQVPHPAGLDGILQSPAMPKPNFTLTDTSGHPFNLQADTQGDATLLYFGYTHCPDICPTHMADIALGLARQSPAVRAHLKVVFVTTDPARDTPTVLRQWLNSFNPTFIGLTGDTAQIDAAEASVGMPPSVVEPLGNGNYSVDHAAWVIAFTPDNLAHAIYPSGLDSPAVWAHDMPRLVKWPA